MSKSLTEQFDEKRKSLRGFASMTREQNAEISRKGGIAAHAKGKGHEFTSEEARAAGAKGGAIVSADREHMREMGRRGGIAAGKSKAAKRAAQNSGV